MKQILGFTNWIRIIESFKTFYLSAQKLWQCSTWCVEIWHYCHAHSDSLYFCIGIARQVFVSLSPISIRSTMIGLQRCIILFVRIDLDKSQKKIMRIPSQQSLCWTALRWMNISDVYFHTSEVLYSTFNISLVCLDIMSHVRSNHLLIKGILCHESLQKFSVGTVAVHTLLTCLKWVREHAAK